MCGERSTANASAAAAASSFPWSTSCFDSGTSAAAASSSLSLTSSLPLSLQLSLSLSRQLRRYSACLDIFALQPTRPHRELGDLAAFLAAVAPSYPNSKAAQALPRDLAKLLSSAAAPSMDPPLRLTLAKSLMLLRNRGVVAAEELLPLWVSCLRLQDKNLRKLVCAHVVADVKRSNSKRRDDRLNRAAQAALGASASSDESSAAARASLGLLAELWRRRLWRDARTANAVAGGFPICAKTGISDGSISGFIQRWGRAGLPWGDFPGGFFRCGLPVFPRGLFLEFSS